MLKIVKEEHIEFDNQETEVIGGNYLSKVIEFQKLHLGSGVHSVLILHDEWCALLRNKGACNCDPQVTLLEDKN